MSQSYQVAALVTKLKDSDPDLRIMGLMDVGRRATDPGFGVDDATETQLVEQVLTMFNDSIAEVKSLAAKTISILVAKVKEDRVQTIIEKLTTMTSAKDDQLRDVASLGLKTVVKEISPDSKLANTACNKLAPKILAQLKNTSSSQDLLIQLIEVLADVYARFDSTIRSLPNAQSEGSSGLTPLLNDSRGAVRKRAIRALGNLISCSSDNVFTTLLDKEVLPALNGNNSTPEQLKTAVALASTLAVSAPKKSGKRVSELVGPVLKATESSDEELKEVALQTLETFLLKCPTETTPFIPQIVDAANKLIKYDPNYAAGDDDMEDAGGDESNGMDEDGVDNDGEEEDEEYEEEDYDDDDDVSWKVRRGSVKVLQMAIETRHEMLSTFYKTIAPVLIQRFGEREETVKLEVWATYTALLKQTGVFAGTATTMNAVSVGGSGSDTSMPGSRAQSPATSLKRKRDEQMESDDSPLNALRSQTPQVTKAIIKQLSSSKSVAIRLAGFQLLYQLILVLQSGLESNTASLVSVIETILKTADSGSSHGSASGSTTSLKIQIYAFLALFFKTHHLRTIQPHLGKLVPLLVKSIGDKSPKIGAAAFTAASELVKVIKPLSTPSPTSPSVSTNAGSGNSANSQQLRSIFDATVTCLARSDIDQEIRERGIVCLGDLVIHAGGEFGQDLQKALQILKDRLRNENTRLITLMTLSKVAEANTISKNPVFGSFLQEVAEEVVGFLRKTNKPVQAASFVCLEALLRRGSRSLPSLTCQNIIQSLQPSIANPDIHLARSLNSLATILSAHGDTVSTVEPSILPSIYTLISGSTAAITGPALISLLNFFEAYVNAGGDALAVVAKLRELAGTATVGVQAQMTASKCIGVVYRCVVESDKKSAEKIIKDTATKLKSAKTDPSVLCLNLLTAGEIGRKTDMQNHQEIFNAALASLSGSSEDVRSASAFAIGNMAAGSPTIFLPAVLKEIQKASQDDRKMHLLLGSVKEILSYSSPSALSELSNTLWDPLFQICEKASAQQQAATAANGSTGSSAKAGDEARLDGTRNIAAECLGKITLTNPSVYLGQLQSRLNSKSAGTRAAVITAVRFTFSDDSSAYDDLLAPLIVSFLSLMHDEDLTVRRLAVSSMTSAAHNKPQLVREHMAALQPLLYEETKIDPTLIREVVMGPFKVKVDNGLNIRKAAFQCMYTLLETCLNKLDLNAFLDIVVGGLSDDDDIKVSCYLMLVKLGSIAPTAVVQRLDAAAKPFDDILKTKLKDTAVKQETEKLVEMQKSALRTMAALIPLSSEAATPRFSQVVNETKAGVLWGSEFKDMIANAAENKSASGGADRMDID